MDMGLVAMVQKGPPDTLFGASALEVSPVMQGLLPRPAANLADRILSRSSKTDRLSAFLTLLDIISNLLTVVTIF